ncbi:hypothetical protein K438DRAFT_1855820 [Mycena galopus ATCC 62051]|nr:hypothetical protein K438DRAFT_1855820 [Mycena galopus ATCC 62051]
MTHCVKGSLVPHTAGRCIWQFEHDTLTVLTSFLWDNVKSNVKLLPTRPKPTSTFPCQDDKGEFIFISSDGSAAIQAGPKEGFESCHLCLAEINVKKMRDHVGCHIAASLNGIQEKHKHPIGDEPCGFCRQSGTCNIDLEKQTNHLFPSLHALCFENSAYRPPRKPPHLGLPQTDHCAV